MVVDGKKVWAFVSPVQKHFLVMQKKIKKLMDCTSIKKDCREQTIWPRWSQEVAVTLLPQFLKMSSSPGNERKQRFWWTFQGVSRLCQFSGIRGKPLKQLSIFKGNILSHACAYVQDIKWNDKSDALSWFVKHGSTVKYFKYVYQKIKV